MTTKEFFQKIIAGEYMRSDFKEIREFIRGLTSEELKILKRDIDLLAMHEIENIVDNDPYLKEKNNKRLTRLLKSGRLHSLQQSKKSPENLGDYFLQKAGLKILPGTDLVKSEGVRKIITILSSISPIIEIMSKNITDPPKVDNFNELFFNEYKDLEKQFINILRKVKPPLVDENNNYIKGRLKTGFVIWINELINFKIIRDDTPKGIYADILKKTINNFSIDKGYFSRDEKRLKRAKDLYENDFITLISTLKSKLKPT